jgi:integrase
MPTQLIPARPGLDQIKAELPLAGVHVFRHSAAKLRRDVGESIEDVGRFLDHSSLAVTTVYLRRLEGQHDAVWGKVAAALRMGTASGTPDPVTRLAPG